MAEGSSMSHFHVYISMHFLGASTFPKVIIDEAGSMTWLISADLRAFLHSQSNWVVFLRFFRHDAQAALWRIMEDWAEIHKNSHEEQKRIRLFKDISFFCLFTLVSHPLASFSCTMFYSAIEKRVRGNASCRGVCSSDTIYHHLQLCVQDHRVWDDLKHKHVK